MSLDATAEPCFFGSMNAQLDIGVQSTNEDGVLDIRTKTQGNGSIRHLQDDVGILGLHLAGVALGQLKDDDMQNLPNSRWYGFIRNRLERAKTQVGPFVDATQAPYSKFIPDYHRDLEALEKLMTSPNRAAIADRIKALEQDLANLQIAPTAASQSGDDASAWMNPDTSISDLGVPGAGSGVCSATLASMSPIIFDARGVSAGGASSRGDLFNKSKSVH